MDEEEEIICKLIKCSYLVGGQVKSIVDVQTAVPGALDSDGNTKRLKLIDLLERFSQELHDHGF